MISIKDYFNEVLIELELCESKMEKLQLVLEYSKDLEEFPITSKIKENEVPGCTSNVFIDCFKQKDGTIEFKATSDALIVGGYIAILFEGINDRKPIEILENWNVILDFTKKAGIKESLTITRANAFSNILNIIFKKVENFK